VAPLMGARWGPQVVLTHITSPQNTSSIVGHRGGVASLFVVKIANGFGKRRNHRKKQYTRAPGRRAGGMGGGDGGGNRGRKERSGGLCGLVAVVQDLLECLFGLVDD